MSSQFHATPNTKIDSGAFGNRRVGSLPPTFGDRNQQRVTMPKLPPPAPVWAHQRARLGSAGSRVATTLRAVPSASTTSRPYRRSAAKPYCRHKKPNAPPETCAPIPRYGLSPAGTVTPRPRKKPAVCLAQRRPRIDFERTHSRLIADARHQRRGDDHSDIRIIDEALEAVTAAARHNSTAFSHGLLNSLNHLVGVVDETYIVGLAPESLVESSVNESRVPRIVWSNPVANNWCLLMFNLHRTNIRRSDSRYRI